MGIYDRFELHLGKYIPFQIDTGGNFQEMHSIFLQGEHGSLCDVEDFLMFGAGICSAEGDLVYCLNELFSLFLRRGWQLAATPPGH